MVLGLEVVDLEEVIDEEETVVAWLLLSGAFLVQQALAAVVAGRWVVAGVQRIVRVVADGTARQG